MLRYSKVVQVLISLLRSIDFTWLDLVAFDLKHALLALRHSSLPFSNNSLHLAVLQVFIEAPVLDSAFVLSLPT